MRPEDGSRRTDMIDDVCRAYFYAKISRGVYIELPKEDPHYGKDMLGKLTLLYNRTRQASITTELIEIISGASALEE